MLKEAHIGGTDRIVKFAGGLKWRFSGDYAETIFLL